VSHAGEKLDPVSLDFHPAAASVPLLTPPEFAVNCRRIDLQTGRHSLEDRNQCSAVGFAGSCKSKIHLNFLPFLKAA
jgi:hypothetical protein